MLDGMSDSIQGSRIENLHSREVDRQSPTGLIFIIIITVINFTRHYVTCMHGLLTGSWEFLLISVVLCVSASIGTIAMGTRGDRSPNF